MNQLSSDIMYLKGVGPFRAKLLNKLHIYTVNDLLEFLPRTYIFRKTNSLIKDLNTGEYASIVGKIVYIDEHRTTSGKKQLNVIITDGNSNLTCTWFRYGKWLLDDMKTGSEIWVNGLISEFKRDLQIVHPQIEILDDLHSHDDFWHTREILPVYPLTDKLKIRTMRNLVYQCFKLYHEYITETLPENILNQYGFESRYISLQRIHFPTDISKTDLAKKRLAFEELFYQQLMLNRCHYFQKKHDGKIFELKKTYTTKLKNSLPFSLTNAQKRVIREIVSDMTSNKQMNRLIQGDVGSGKTIVTLFAILLALENDFQSVLLAPTELLAEQHYKSFQKLLENQPEIKIALLKGGNYKGKKDTKEKIKNGEFDIIIGTHALIQKDVEFCKVGLVTIDEQHRFGVEQRAELVRKNNFPDLLYLSATPIPRSLALTIYGDLDVSIIDELPPTRKPVQTYWRGESKKKLVYNEILQQVQSGRQIYIVCPLIEESEKMDLLDANTLFNQISEEIFPQFKASLLHGKMKPVEKDEIMNEFKEGKIDILVSTTVIEVGIDVPNASVMMIEHAERFGLSQLHQLRGRVGRGADFAFCYLIAYPPLSKDGKERLTTMVATSDGFKIAEKDLQIRGPGDFFGKDQSGLPIYKHANIIRDQQLLKEARVLAQEITSVDADFKHEENKLIRDKYFSVYLDKEKLFRF